MEAAVAAAAAEAAKPSESKPSTLDGPSVDALTEGMAKLMEEMQDPEFAKTLQETFQQLSTGGNGDDLPSMMNPFSMATPGENDSELDENLVKTLQVWFWFSVF